ncbi:Mediator complex subunit Med10 [Trinorchestia longiramus]|nr:Mediator complex subunit Med10 [Trinorchestia longiramus]
MSSSLEQLENHLETFIENVRQIGILVSDFQPQGQQVLNQKLQNMISNMQEIDKLRSPVQEVHVPLEVFEYIDGGRNPQLYTKDCMEKALAKNEQVNGRIQSYKAFKAGLLVELAHVFPNEMNRYRAVRELSDIN